MAAGFVESADSFLVRIALMCGEKESAAVNDELTVGMKISGRNAGAWREVRRASRGHGSVCFGIVGSITSLPNIGNAGHKTVPLTCSARKTL